MQTLIQNAEFPTIAISSASGVSVALIEAFISSTTRHLLGGSLVVNLTHNTDDTPLHVQLRSVWYDTAGAEQETPITQFLNSNDETYGNSALVPNSLLLLKSGQNAQFAVPDYVGDGLRIVLMPAGSNAEAVSAMMQLWQVK